MTSKVRLIFWVCVALIFSSCATTRKSTIHTTRIDSDSAVVDHRDSSVFVIANIDSIDHVVNIEEKKENSIYENTECFEIVTEQIIDHQDSVGNKITVTNRTTKRKNKNSTQSNLFDYQRYANHEINTMFSFMDSTVVSQDSNLDYHIQSVDSLNKQTHSSVDSEKTSIWSIIKAFVVLALIVVLEYVVFSLYHVWREKKSN